MKEKNFILVFFLTILLFSCSDKPKDRLLNPIEDIKNSAVGLKELVIYDNELKVGGVMFYTSADNQSLDFFYQDGNNKCIRYCWNGKEVYNYEYKVWQSTRCGFGIIVGKDYTEINKTHNLAPYGFNKLKFKIRGGYLAENVKVKIIGPKNKNDGDIDVKEITSVQLTPDWKQYEINITNNLDDINIYVGVVFENTGTQQSQGGEVFIDDISLVKE
jgi:hypothetical protein